MCELKRTFFRTIIISIPEIIKFLNIPEDGNINFRVTHDGNINCWAINEYGLESWTKNIPKSIIEKKLKLLDDEELIDIEYEPFNTQVFIIKTTKENIDYFEDKYTKEFDETPWYKQIFLIKKDINRLYIKEI